MSTHQAGPNRSAHDDERRIVAPWVLTVARNRAIDVARRNRPHAVHRAGEDRLDSLAGAGIIDDQVIANDRAHHLWSVLGQLPEAQREVITLAFYGQLTHNEIAARLELPLGTGKGRIRLASERMRGDVAHVPS